MFSFNITAHIYVLYTQIYICVWIFFFRFSTKLYCICLQRKSCIWNTSLIAQGECDLVTFCSISTFWFHLWKQRKEKNLTPPTAFFVHSTLLKSNTPVLCGALNYLLNWQFFPHCCCCTNRHFLQRPWNCREVTHTAYYQLLTLYNERTIAGTIVLKPSKPSG